MQAVLPDQCNLLRKRKSGPRLHFAERMTAVMRHAGTAREDGTALSGNSSGSGALRHHQEAASARATQQADVTSESQPKTRQQRRNKWSRENFKRKLAQKKQQDYRDSEHGDDLARV